MKKPERLGLFLVLLLAAAAPALFGLNPLLMTIKIQSIMRAGPPEYLDQQVLFSYQSEKPVRLVGARFEHEEYRIFHPYFKNENGIFLLLLDIPEGAETLTYRVVVDGLWMHDPFNPERREDPFGVSFSTFSLAEKPEKPLISPEIGQNGEVTFWYRSAPGHFVSVIGEFNHWDPYWDRMEEIRPGLYRASLKMPAGQHYYGFSVDGERTLDPRNVENAQDYEGFRVSTVVIPPAKTR